jgi:hypothetical protein
MSYLEEVVPKRRTSDKRQVNPFGMFYLDGAITLLQRDLRGQDLRVLWGLMEQMGFNEPFRPYMRRVAEVAGIDSSSVSRSVRRLKEEAVIFDQPDGQLLIDPTIAWRGDGLGRISTIHRLRHEGIPLPLPGKD